MKIEKSFYISSKKDQEKLKLFGISDCFVYVKLGDAVILTFNWKSKMADAEKNEVMPFFFSKSDEKGETYCIEYPLNTVGFEFCGKTELLLKGNVLKVGDLVFDLGEV